VAKLVRERIHRVVQREREVRTAPRGCDVLALGVRRDVHLAAAVPVVLARAAHDTNEQHVIVLRNQPTQPFLDPATPLFSDVL
jgi:hypothetical protein